jgi:hypothetical protein
MASEEGSRVLGAVTREAARRVAETYLAQHPDLGYSGVSGVHRWSEIPGGVRGVYWVRHRPSPGQLEQTWVAYLEEPGPMTVLKSSSVVIIDGESGAVLYVGSANDEG